MPTEAWKDDAFVKNRISLAHCEIDTTLGTVRAVPISLTGHDAKTLTHLAEQDLQHFFAAHGVEMRGTIVRTTERLYPLGKLIEITAELLTTDTVEVLENVLTEADIRQLYDWAGTNANGAEVTARCKPIVHKGITVNYEITLRARKNSKPLRERPNTCFFAAEGSVNHPVELKDGSYFFALSAPFGCEDEQGEVTVKEIAGIESQIAAARLGAILTRIDGPTGW